MNEKLKYVSDCRYCNAIIEAMMKKSKDQSFGPSTNMFRVNDAAKLVDGEDPHFPKIMSRKTAFKHIKEFQERKYLDDGYDNLKIAYCRLSEIANPTVPSSEILKFRDEKINQMLEFIGRKGFRCLTIGLRICSGEVMDIP
ncbi:MAG: hypothetical protein ACP5UV_04485 [Thermoplasmata archaeon]